MSSAAQRVPPPQPEPVSGARLVVEALEREGVTHVFGYPGGAIMPVYDALTGSKLQHILVRHEQAAALAADAYGRVTGRPGVCIATSGPGATNLVTGIANAFLDSVPMVAITGQVASPLMGTDAFQEVDIFGITLPIVKHSFLIRRTADIPRVFAEAARLDKAVEIDCYPDRQDLNLTSLKLARAAGTRVSLGTDAHHPWQLEFIQLGLASALRARIPAERIINFMSAQRIKRWIAGLRERSR